MLNNVKDVVDYESRPLVVSVNIHLLFCLTMLSFEKKCLSKMFFGTQNPFFNS